MLVRNLMKRKRNNTFIYFILLLICIFLNCTNKTENAVNNTYNENDLEYSINIKNERNSIVFYLDKDMGSINVLMFSGNVLINKNCKIKIDNKQADLFISIIKEQLEITKINSNRNDIVGNNLTFTIWLNTDYLSAVYCNVSDFKEDISLKFDTFFSLFRKDENVDKFLKEKMGI